jgi:DNA-binding XRE family transcriptional regulator
MQVVVKKPPIKLEGEITPNLIDFLKNEFGPNEIVEVVDQKDEELIDVTGSEWYRNIKKSISPGDTLRFYREMRGLTQAELGVRIGRFSRQYISNLENGHRPISKAVAIRLAELFEVSVDRFI